MSSRAATVVAGLEPWRERARYFNPGEAFSQVLSPVPSIAFTHERDRAFAAATPTSLIDMDLSATLNTTYPATTPLVMSRYLRVRASEHLQMNVRASMQLLVICVGTGRTQINGESVNWRPGDVLMLPGGALTEHLANDDAVLWLLTDEPALNYLGLDPVAVQRSAIQPVHYAAVEMQQQLEAIYAHPDAAQFPGFGLMLAHAGTEDIRTIHPAMTMALNTLPAGEKQRPHTHNAMALTMCIQGEGVYSVVDGERKDWSPFAVMVTPPGAAHYHANEGSKRMQSMVLQDGGLYSYARTPGFAFAD